MWCEGPERNRNHELIVKKLGTKYNHVVKGNIPGETMAVEEIHL